MLFSLWPEWTKIMKNWNIWLSRFCSLIPDFRWIINTIWKSMKLYFPELCKKVSKIFAIIWAFTALWDINSKQMTTFWKSRLIYPKLTKISLNFKYLRRYFLINMWFLRHFCNFLPFLRHFFNFLPFLCSLLLRKL